MAGSTAQGAAPLGAAAPGEVSDGGVQSGVLFWQCRAEVECGTVARGNARGIKQFLHAV